MVIDGKNKKGVRISASVDDVLWSLFQHSKKSESEARAAVREFMLTLGGDRNSACVRTWLLLQIAKPSLRDRHLGLLGDQIDIEEA